MDFMMKSSFFCAELSKTTCPGFPSCETRGPAHVCWEGISFTRQHLGRHVGPRPPCSWALPVLHWSPKNMHWPLRQILIYIFYIYIYRLKAGGSPELRGTLSLDAIPERSFLYTDGGVGGGVIASCEVRWMMLNPGRCCLVGRCCYVASFVVVYRRGGRGGGVKRGPSVYFKIS